MTIEVLKERIHRLSNMLDDTQPGLSTWNALLTWELEALMDEWFGKERVSRILACAKACDAANLPTQFLQTGGLSRMREAVITSGQGSLAYAHDLAYEVRKELGSDE
jgi:hypothetical protein